MDKSIKTMDSLRDSRILFDKQPPAFGFILILIVGVLLCFAVIWSIYTPKVYTIQAQGTITSEKTNYVMPAYTGEIEESNLQEGLLVKKGDVLFSIKSTDYDLQEEQLLETREIYEKQVTYNQLLIQSIKDDKNYFDESDAAQSLYYSTFEKYKSKVEQMKVDTKAFEMYGYTEEQIEEELIKNQSKIDELYYTEIQSAESAIEQAKAQISSIDAQLTAISSGKDAYEVKATTTGIVHLLENYKNGMVIQAGTAIATITPENETHVIEAYVSAADMARMHEEDEVQIVVDGLSQSVYGTISGTVKQIDSNVTTQQRADGSTAQLFKVLMDMDSDYLVSRSGEKVDLSNGMTAIARIQYDKVTYFRYILEKLGFKEK